ncbi:hypothetical protein [Dyella sp. 2RAB6]|uniref:hypothetical protein n=1 Tax=Dyella sp. 2RAB6 TaxID=3232992 RepID=UPI003F8E7F06
MFIPSLSLCDGVLIRRKSLFKQHKMLISSVAKIMAINRDALTHDEVLIAFISATGEQLMVSELEKDFHLTMDSICKLFVGMKPWRDIEEGAPLEFRSLVLWEREVQLDDVLRRQE